MPIDMVVGGQFGSEGKGKVALELKRRRADYAYVVRPGGTNSGHTGYDRGGQRMVLRQLPAAAIDGDVAVIFPAGSYVDPDLLLKEIELTGIAPGLVHMDRRAQLIRPEHRDAEAHSGLLSSIGSTGSGTGAAVMSRLARYGRGSIPGMPVEEHAALQPFICDVAGLLDDALSRGRGVLLEGTQGFGLSVLHGDSWPKATARDTTAAGFLSEAGLPPRKVRDVVMVLRALPIRVAGDSGPLLGETDWAAVGRASDAQDDMTEYTSVTNRVRRVGCFDAAVVRRAIAANDPSLVVLNHLDHVDAAVRGTEPLTDRTRRFVDEVERGIGRRVEMVGTGPQSLRAAHADAGSPA